MNKWPKGIKKGAFCFYMWSIYCSTNLMILFSLLCHIIFSSWSVLTDYVWLSPFLRSKSFKISPTPTASNFITSPALIAFMFYCFKVPLWNLITCLQFSNRFDIAVVVSEIQRLIRGKRDQSPKWLPNLTWRIMRAVVTFHPSSINFIFQYSPKSCEPSKPNVVTMFIRWYLKGH